MLFALAMRLDAVIASSLFLEKGGMIPTFYNNHFGLIAMWARSVFYSVGCF